MSEERGLVSAAVAGVAPTEAARWVRMNCPVCAVRTGKPDRKRSFGFESSSGRYGCFKCGFKGKLFGWGVGGYEVPSEPPRPAHPAVRSMAPPEGYCPLWEGAGSSSAAARAAREYARGRVREALWRELQIGATVGGSGPQSGRVIVPVLDVDGRWVGWVGRSWSAQSRLPYYTCPGMEKARVLYNQVALSVETDVPLLVVEGVFDAIHAWPNAVAVLGKPSREQVAMLVDAPRPVSVVLDGDAWEEAEMLAHDLRTFRAEAEGVARAVGFVRLPPGVDPDEVPVAELMEMAKDSLKKENARWE